VFLRAGTVCLPLLGNYCHLLPEPDPGMEPQQGAQTYRRALAKFKRSAGARYREAALERLLHAPVADVRQAAVLALGLLGSPEVNAALADRLHDKEPAGSGIGAGALWALLVWGRTQGNKTRTPRGL